MWYYFYVVDPALSLDQIELVVEGEDKEEPKSNEKTRPK